VPAYQARLYESVITRIQAGVATDETIFAFPSHAELYFLAARRNPTPYFNLGLWIRSRQDAEALVAALDGSRPRLVIFDSYDPQWTDPAEPILAWAKGVAEERERIERFVLFWIPDATPE
jgi:hypothetical protein